MPSGSGSSATINAGKGKDFYKILQVSRTATAQEIKVAYYKLALTLHPDKHQGCTVKEAQFKQVNEAYNVLSNTSRRNEYDFSTGHRHNHNNRNHHPRRTTVPPDYYRKVYSARPPPGFTKVWDHALHYEMHYGDGFQKMTLERLRKEMQRNGQAEYQSPLGRGFYFSNEPLEGLHGTTTNNHNNNNTIHNPFSKRPQGPHKFTVEYSEGSLNASTGQETIRRRERIVQELHTVRSQRQQQQQQQQQQRRQQQQQTSHPSGESPFAQYSTQAAASRHWSSSSTNDNNNNRSSRQQQQREEEDFGCVIS